MLGSHFSEAEDLKKKRYGTYASPHHLTKRAISETEHYRLQTAAVSHNQTWQKQFPQVKMTEDYTYIYSFKITTNYKSSVTSTQYL